MVHIKRVELAHFKSFKQAQVPFLPGFTVISGPNGSGKSNILDALLFCLSLSTTKGMRADKLPDLVNNNPSLNGGAQEATVSVTFDLSDLNQEDWTVTRRLRVSKGGNYASSFYINGKGCTVTELYEEMQALRIYPEGYNVVLQGDVTHIITMNSRDRREIIDELAGVALFDRKIDQAKATLEAVKAKEEPSYVLEQELTRNLQRLENDRLKAEKYQQLKAKIQQKQQWEVVLLWRDLQQQQKQLENEITSISTELHNLRIEINTLGTDITQAAEQLEQLNQQVKVLGEEEQLTLASELAHLKANYQQIHSRREDLNKQAQSLAAGRLRRQEELGQYQQTLISLTEKKKPLESQIQQLNQECEQQRSILAEYEQQAAGISESAQNYIEQQTALSRQIALREADLNPQRREEAQLTERQQQLKQKIEEQTQLQQSLRAELADKQEEIRQLGEYHKEVELQSLAQNLSDAEKERNLASETQTRLLKEQREKQRQLDKLEATRQAQQEAQGSYALNQILPEIEGIYGLVAHLGQVEPRYQLALSIAAGGRMGYIVVQNDQVAARAIALLKQRRAGRASFLPLNKIQAPRLMETGSLRSTQGFINLAVNLIEYQPVYRDIFAFVFGNTVVFENLDTARPFLGNYRIVTLEGDILETSGAMTGGSVSSKNTLQFGITSGESAESESLQKRLAEIEQILIVNEMVITEKIAQIQEITNSLNELRSTTREYQLRFDQLNKEQVRYSKQKNEVSQQLEANIQELQKVSDRLNNLSETIPQLEAEVSQYQLSLEELEQANQHEEWQQLQNLLKIHEAELKTKEKQWRQAEEELKALSNQRLRMEEKITETEQKEKEYLETLQENESQQQELIEQQEELKLKIEEKEIGFEYLGNKLKEVKGERDRQEKSLKVKQQQQQEKIWQEEKLATKKQEKQDQLKKVSEELEVQEKELPEPLPEVPVLVAETEETEGIEAITFKSFGAQLEQLRKELNSLGKRLQAMEPVNMLALEEYEQTQSRLEELSAKLTTLKAERNELLLRIENFTTLRLSAFKEAFEVVNRNFQEIFALLSEGDGYLELEDPEDPFKGGLNLIAHPKGKPVLRLSSMSGGEKSLTALSFIFALQRYRPSPFYAFDEVDMFLDGANVERLAKMIKQQAQEAQFIVVSLRLPMIESSQQTIGVTQARGAYTQVLGIKL